MVNGLLYAVGGVGTPGSTSGFMSTVEAYDATANRWTTRPQMPTPRSELGVGVLNGSLYAIGGYAPLNSNSYGFVATNAVFHP